MRLSHSQADGVGDTLAERTSGNLDTIGMTCFGVTGSQGVKLTELLEVVQGKLVSQQMEGDILKCATRSPLIFVHY